MKKELDFQLQARLGQKIHEKCGVDFLSDGFDGRYFRTESFYRTADIRDVLDSITMCITLPLSKDMKIRWISNFAEILEEEAVGYSVDDVGTVHPKFDNEFERSRLGSIAVLDQKDLETAKKHVDAMEKFLLTEPPEFSSALREIFLANENVFKVLYPNEPRLAGGRLSATLKLRLGGADIIESERLSTNKFVSSFHNWIDAAHFVRHSSANPEVEAISNSYGLAMISLGLGYLRWMAEMVERTND